MNTNQKVSKRKGRGREGHPTTAKPKIWGSSPVGAKIVFVVVVAAAAVADGGESRSEEKELAKVEQEMVVVEEEEVRPNRRDCSFH